MSRKFGIELEITGITQSKAAAALRAVGIEVITPGYTHRTTLAWKIVPDSSVNNGFEVVSPILEGESGREEADTVINALKTAGAHADRSCGLHVHFDAADLGVEELRCIISRYARWEAEIDAFMPPSRRGSENRFCRSVRGLPESSDFRNASTVSGLAHAQPGRYFKVNLQSLLRQGTIEFRQHNGIVDADRTLNWVKLLEEFIAESVRVAHASAPVPTPAVSLLASHRRIIEHLRNGLTNAASLAETLGVQPHSLRAAISRIRQAGINIRSTRRGGSTHYQLAEAQTAAGSNDSLWAGIDSKIAKFYRNRAAVMALA